MSFGGGAPSAHCSSQNDFESTLGVIGFLIMGVGWLFFLPALFFVTIYYQIRKWSSKNPDAIE